MGCLPLIDIANNVITKITHPYIHIYICIYVYMYACERTAGGRRRTAGGVRTAAGGRLPAANWRVRQEVQGRVLAEGAQHIDVTHMSK